MTAHAMLYCLDLDALDLEEIARAAELPSVVPGRDRQTGGTRFELRLGDTQAVLVAVPREETQAQLQELASYLAEACELSDTSVPGRVMEASAALELAFDPGLDAEGRCERFLRAIASRAQAFVYRDDGSLEAPSGEKLARPRAAPLHAAAPGPAAAAPLPAAVAFPEPRPQPLERVARRALVVVALTWRSVVERRKPANAAELLEGCSAWLDQHDLWDELEPEEAALLRAPAGGWSERAVTDASWAIEGAAVLAWALRLAELPSPDVQVDSSALGHALGLFTRGPPALAVKELRPTAELGAMARRLAGVHLRLRQFQASPGRVDLAAFARECWPGGFDLEGLPLARADLAVGGQPLWAASERAAATALSIATERDRAVRWLVGMTPRWVAEAPPPPGTPTVSG